MNIQVFHHPMHGNTNWMYVIDVVPHATRLLQDINKLSLIDNTNKVIIDNDKMLEEEGSFTKYKLVSSSSSMYEDLSTKTTSAERLLDTLELEGNIDSAPYVDGSLKKSNFS